MPAKVPDADPNAPTLAYAEAVPAIPVSLRTVAAKLFGGLLIAFAVPWTIMAGAFAWYAATDWYRFRRREDLAELIIPLLVAAVSWWRGLRWLFWKRTTPSSVVGQDVISAPIDGEGGTKSRTT